jgi:hypothetical protein
VGSEDVFAFTGPSRQSRNNHPGALERWLAFTDVAQQ